MLRPYRGQMPRIHPTAYIDDSAQVIGDVEIGEDSSVWMAVVIRGDVHRILIGRRTNVQDGTVIHVMRDTHPTTIGDNVTIGHAAVVRCIPNLACRVSQGVVPWVASQAVAVASRREIERLLGALGTAVPVGDERDLDLATPVSSAHAMPSAQPARTSVGKCTPR